MTTITMSRSDFTAILKQARREQEADDAGFVTHAAMVAAHRESRRRTLRARQEARHALWARQTV